MTRVLSSLHMHHGIPASYYMPLLGLSQSEMPTSVPCPRSPLLDSRLSDGPPAKVPLPFRSATRGCRLWDARFRSASTCKGSCVFTCREGLSPWDAHFRSVCLNTRGVVSRYNALIQVALRPEPRLDSDLSKRRRCSPFFPRSILLLFKLCHSVDGIIVIL